MKRSIWIFIGLLTVTLAYGQNDDSRDIERDAEAMSAATSAEIDYQIPVQNVSVDDKPMSLGVEPSYTLYVRDMKDKDVHNKWKDFIKENGNAKGKKVKGAKHELRFEQANLYEIGSGKIDVYSTVFKSGDDSELVAWFIVDDRFLGPNVDDATSQKAQAFMQKFGVYLEKLKVEDEIEHEEDELKDRRKEYEKLQKEKRKLEDKIEGWRRDIEEAERKIVENLSDQETKTDEIKTQEEKTRRVKAKLNKF